MFHINTDHAGLFPPYSVTMFSAFVLGIGLLWLLNRKDGIPKNIAGLLVLLSPVMIVSCAAGTGYLMSHGQTVGLSSMGALFGMYLSVIIMALICGNRGHARLMLQNCTLVLPLMYAVSKFGCFLAGCCRGVDYDGIFCVRYTGAENGGVTAFPVQLAESLTFLVIFAVGMLLRRRHRSSSVRSVFLPSALAKGLLDFLRAEHQGRLVTVNQILCAVLIGICLAWMLLDRRCRSSHQNRLFSQS